MSHQEKCNHCPLAGIDRPCPGQRVRRLCRKADCHDPKHDPAIIPHILAWRPRGQEVPSAKETMAIIRRIKECPSWERDPTCGCGLNRCSEGKGKNGVISQLDCLACLREKDRQAGQTPA